MRSSLPQLPYATCAEFQVLSFRAFFLSLLRILKTNLVSCFQGCKPRLREVKLHSKGLTSTLSHPPHAGVFQNVGLVGRGGSWAGWGLRLSSHVRSRVRDPRRPLASGRSRLNLTHQLPGCGIFHCSFCLVCSLIF